MEHAASSEALSRVLLTSTVYGLADEARMKETVHDFTCSLQHLVDKWNGLRQVYSQEYKPVRMDQREEYNTRVAIKLINSCGLRDLILISAELITIRFGSIEFESKLKDVAIEAAHTYCTSLYDCLEAVKVSVHPPDSLSSVDDVAYTAGEKSNEISDASPNQSDLNRAVPSPEVDTTQRASSNSPVISSPPPTENLVSKMEPAQDMEGETCVPGNEPGVPRKNLSPAVNTDHFADLQAKEKIGSSLVNDPKASNAHSPVTSQDLNVIDVADSTGLKSNTEVEPGSEPEAEPKAESEVEHKVEPEFEPEAEPELEPESDPRVELEVERGVKPSVEPSVEPEVGPEVEPEVGPEVEPEVAPEAEDGKSDEPLLRPSADSHVLEQSKPESESPQMEKTAPAISVRETGLPHTGVEHIKEDHEIAGAPSSDTTSADETNVRDDVVAKVEIDPHTIQTMHPVKGGAIPDATARLDTSTDPESRPSIKRAALFQLSLQKYKQFQSIAASLVVRIQEHRFSLPFLQPVNARDAPNYADVVREPRDLKNILRLVKSKTESPCYSSIKHLERDIMLMFANCIMYNKSGDDLTRLTISMRDDVQKLFEMYEEAELDIF